MMKTSAFSLILASAIALPQLSAQGILPTDGGSQSAPQIEADVIADWVKELSNLSAEDRALYTSSFAKAKSAYAKGLMAECESHLNTCEFYTTSNPNVWNLRASVRISQQRFEEAKPLLDAVRRFNPQDSVARLSYSLLYLGTGEYETVREPVYDRWGRVTGYQNVRREKTVVESRATYDRAYYETVCDSDEVSSRCSTITRIDAVLYNNHGIFGRLGSCTVNGSLVCRNEGLQYSGKLYLNWDIRLFSGSNETVDNENVGLAKASDNTPRTLAWMQIPQNQVSFAAEEEGD